MNFIPIKSSEIYLTTVRIRC